MNGDFLTYDQWIKIHPEALKQEKDCPECEGSGEQICWHCHSEYECPDCEGTGKIKTAKKAYAEQLKKDKANWEKLKTIQTTEVRV